MVVPESFGHENSGATLTSVPVSKGNYENCPGFSFLISKKMKKSLCYSFKASPCGFTSDGSNERSAIRKSVQSGLGGSGPHPHLSCIPPHPLKTCFLKGFGQNALVRVLLYA